MYANFSVINPASLQDPSLVPRPAVTPQAVEIFSFQFTLSLRFVIAAGHDVLGIKNYYKELTCVGVI